MRIRKFSAHSVTQSSSSSPSPSSSTSSITTNSLVSSTDSSSSAPSTSSSFSTTRCQGLDLLVKAIHQVTAGSVVGVPYIQRRVIRRRRRRSLSFETLCIAEYLKKKGQEDDKEEPKKGNLIPRRPRRLMGSSPKFQDPLLEQWKPKNKSRRGRSIKTGDDIDS